MAAINLAHQSDGRITIDKVKTLAGIDYSRHTLRMEVLAGFLLRNPSYTSLFASPDKNSILEKLFFGRRVLNIAPENDSATGVLRPLNLMTSLRELGIDSWAVSPVESLYDWKEFCYKENIQRMLGIPDNSYDDVVILCFFCPFYGSVRKEELPATAKELRRVLKNMGRLFVDDNHGSSEGLLQQVLLDTGFEKIVDITPEAAIYINDKH